MVVVAAMVMVAMVVVPMAAVTFEIDGVAMNFYFVVLFYTPMNFLFC
jgi:hypothetical protein